MDSAPPISKLNDDILWYIFSLNSHPNISFGFDLKGNIRHSPTMVTHGGPFREPSLINMRMASQVCAQWRGVVLNSASLWANAIDLHHLKHVGNEWREEVIRRTSTAPLAVIGLVDADDIVLADFFLSILENQWERIRSLVVVSASHDVDQKILLALTRRAPLLELFAIELHTPPDDRKIIPFANCAPLLSALNTGKQVVDLSVLSGVSRIRYLSLTWSQRTISLPDLLRSINNMPLLETLDILDSTLDLSGINRTALIPHIHLPQLKSLTIDENRFTPTLDILSCITLSHQCSLLITCQSTQGSPRPGYADFVKEHFKAWGITKLSYAVELIKPLEGMEHGGVYRQHICLYRGQNEFLPHFGYFGFSFGASNAFYMADTLYSCTLRGVTTFNLSLEGEDYETFLTHSSFDDMYDLLRKLKSVKTFQTNQKTLDMLLAEEPSLSDFMFPKLCTLIVDEWDMSVEDFVGLWKDDPFIMRPFTRILLSEKTRTPVGDPDVLQRAASAGVTVGWKIRGLGGVREFPPKETSSSE